MDGEEDSLKRVTGDTQFLTMIRQQVLELLLGEVNSVFGVKLNFPNSEVVNRGKMKHPLDTGLFLCLAGSEFELILNHNFRALANPP
jgi:hypothetical protein